MSASLDPEMLAFATLAATPGLGEKRIRGLVERSGSAVQVLRDEGVNTRALETARRALTRAAALDLRVIHYGSTEYPEQLRDLDDPPPMLYVRGGRFPDPGRTVAVVGTRRASPYGLRMAGRLGRGFARWGWTVVSGMAAGIDARAHRSVLDAGGNTIGVLGSGHEHEYPRSNADLYSDMRRYGWLVSEFEPWVGPRKGTFPQRNRIIAALARAVIVIEAGERSGALSTARRALELGREVLAVPSRADDRQGAGTLRLIRDGAGIVTDVRDVFDALGWIHDRDPPDTRPTAANRSADGGPDDWVLAALGGEELTIDQMGVIGGRSIDDTLVAIARLEVDGRVARSADGTFHRAGD